MENLEALIGIFEYKRRGESRPVDSMKIHSPKPVETNGSIQKKTILRIAVQISIALSLLLKVVSKISLCFFATEAGKCSMFPFRQ